MKICMKLLHKLLPSSKLKQDIPIQYNKLDNLEPIPLGELSIIKPIKTKLNQLFTNKKIHIEKDKSKKLSLIVPYRKREDHLKEFIPFMHNYLQQQNIDYEITIVVQDDTKPFNRAKLMNIGSLHTKKTSDYFIFHDVDMLPQGADYTYTNHTQRLLNYVEERGKENQNKPYPFFGGVTLVPKEIFLQINGFSNNYWQWGKEDDDFLFRHLFKGYTPIYNTKAKVTTLPHEASLTRDTKGTYTNKKEVLKENQRLYQKNRKNFSNFKRGLTQQENEGLNSIDNYTINKIEKKDGVTFIYVQFN